MGGARSSSAKKCSVVCSGHARSARFHRPTGTDVNEAESFVIDSPERECKTGEVGELIMNRLRNLDKVAYVRFASVYLDFKDVQEFMAELQDLLRSKDMREPRRHW